MLFFDRDDARYLSELGEFVGLPSVSRDADDTHCVRRALFLSFSTADEKLHAPNEFMRIRRLREGMRAWEQLWRLLAVT